MTEYKDNKSEMLEAQHLKEFRERMNALTATEAKIACDIFTEKYLSIVLASIKEHMETMQSKLFDISNIINN